MSVLLRIRGEYTLNGEDAPIPPAGLEVGDGLLIEGEQKSCEIENQTEAALSMTVGDLSDGGTQHEIPAGATVSVSGPHPVHIQEVPHAG